MKKKSENRHHIDAIKRKERDKKIYAFYVQHLYKNSSPPTLEKIGEEFGFSRARAGKIMERLKREGYVLRVEGRYHRPFVPNPLIKVDGRGRVVENNYKKHHGKNN